jgi:hypothetical protein
MSVDTTETSFADWMAQQDADLAARGLTRPTCANFWATRQWTRSGPKSARRGRRRMAEARQFASFFAYREGDEIPEPAKVSEESRREFVALCNGSRGWIKIPVCVERHRRIGVVIKAAKGSA